jgi:lactate racemase
MLKEFPTWQGFLEHIDRSPVVIDQWQLEKLALVTRKADVSFHVPGLPADYYPTLWGPGFATAPAAVDALARSLPRGATVAVIPEGPYVLAKAG